MRRWIREADDRLASLDAFAAGVPRADDFGHLTRGPAPRPERKPVAASASREAVAPPAVPCGPTPDVRVETSPRSASGGIVVASGWGGRPRT